MLCSSCQGDANNFNYVLEKILSCDIIVKELEGEFL